MYLSFKFHQNFVSRTKLRLGPYTRTTDHGGRITLKTFYGPNAEIYFYGEDLPILISSSPPNSICPYTFLSETADNGMVVIPLELRRRFDIKSGQDLYLYEIKDGDSKILQLYLEPVKK